MQSETDEQIKRDRGKVIEVVADLAIAGWRGGTPIDILQDKIRDRALPYNADRMVVAIVACLGETFATEDNPEGAVEALGMAMVHGAALAALNHLAIVPIIDLARVFTTRVGELPIHGVGRLARAVLEAPRATVRAHVIALVDSLALTLAKALDDCEVMHGLCIDEQALFASFASEVLAGRRPVVGTVQGIATAHESPGPLQVEACDGTTHEVHAIAAPPLTPDQVDQLHDAMDVLAGDTVRLGKGLPFDPCPTCAAPLSGAPGTVLCACLNGHEHSTQDITAAQERARRDTQPITGGPAQARPPRK